MLERAVLKLPFQDGAPIQRAIIGGALEWKGTLRVPPQPGCPRVCPPWAHRSYTTGGRRRRRTPLCFWWWWCYWLSLETNLHTLQPVFTKCGLILDILPFVLIWVFCFVLFFVFLICLWSTSVIYKVCNNFIWFNLGDFKNFNIKLILVH